MTNKEIKNKLRNLGTQLDEFIMVCLVRGSIDSETARILANLSNRIYEIRKEIKE